MLVTTIMVIFSCFIIPSCVMSRCFPSPVIAMISFTCPWLSSRVSGPCDFRLSYVFPPCSLVTWVQSVIPPCVFKSPSSWLSLWVCLFMFSPPPSPCSLCSFLCSQCFLLVFLYVCTSLVLRSAPACFCVFVFVSYILAFWILCSDPSFVIEARHLLFSASRVQSCVWWSQRASLSACAGFFSCLKKKIKKNKKKNWSRLMY